MSFESKLLCFLAIVGALRVYVRIRPTSSIAQAALSWIGPSPVAGESWARFQWRWALYSVSWLLQMLFAMSAVFLLFMQDDGAYEKHAWLQLIWFALPLGAGVALLAFVGFACTSVKAHLVGPNPVFAAEAEPPRQAGGPAA